MRVLCTIAIVLLFFSGTEGIPAASTVKTRQTTTEQSTDSEEVEEVQGSPTLQSTEEEETSSDQELPNATTEWPASLGPKDVSKEEEASPEANQTDETTEQQLALGTKDEDTEEEASPKSNLNNETVDEPLDFGTIETEEGKGKPELLQSVEPEEREMSTLIPQMLQESTKAVGKTLRPNQGKDEASGGIKKGEEVRPRKLPKKIKGKKKDAPKGPTNTTNPCLENPKLCHHFCNNTGNGGHTCFCDAGYAIGPKDKYRCVPKCLKNQRYDASMPGGECVAAKSTCRPNLGFRPRYPNLESVGKGIDLMKMDPFSESQEGIKNAIFEVYGFNEIGLCEEGYGYSVSTIYKCKSSEYVRKHSTLNSLVKQMKSVANEVLLDQAEGNKTDNRLTEGQGSQSGTDANTASSGSEGGNSCQSNSVGMQLTDATSNQQSHQHHESHTKTVEERKRRKRSLGRSVTALAAAGIGILGSMFSLFGGGPKVTTQDTTSDTWGTINQQSHSKTSNQQASSRDCNTNSVTNQRGLRIMEQLTKDYQKAMAMGQTFQSTLNLNALLSGIYANEKGQTLDKGETVTRRVKGFRDQFIRSQNFMDMVDIYKSDEGAFFVADAWCQHYKATIQKSTLPVFTENFAKRVRKLHLYTALYVHIKSSLTQKIFDGLFKEFAEEFGTHYPEEVEMGSSLLAISIATKEEMKKHNDSDIKSCTQRLTTKAGEEESSSDAGKTWCKSPEFKNVKVNSVERKRTTIVSRGSLVLTPDTREWSKSTDESRSTAIKYKLRPIVTLFTPEVMSIDRIATRDGKPILTHGILSWMFPRYVGICKMYSKDGSHDLCSAMKGCFWGGHECTKLQKCVDDPKDREKGFKCVFAGCSKKRNICKEPGTTCEEDRENPQGFKCIPICSKGNECRTFVEDCVQAMEPPGFKCRYLGCPTGEDVNICKPGKKCKDAKKSKKGYKCADICKDVKCEETEECDRQTGKCKYVGCATGKVRCPEKGTVCIDNPKKPENYTCIESKVKVIIEKSGGHMPWGKWSACSVTCDQGIKKRERECSYLGKWHQECEEFPKKEVVECRERDCPGWSDWSECSVTCGKGKQVRTRCQGPKWMKSRTLCGKLEEERPCELGDCPVPGKWTPWADVGPCSVTCGEGIKLRARVCGPVSDYREETYEYESSEERRNSRETKTSGITLTDASNQTKSTGVTMTRVAGRRKRSAGRTASKESHNKSKTESNASLGRRRKKSAGRTLFGSTTHTKTRKTSTSSQNSSMSSVTNQRGITTPRKKNTTTSERDTNGSIKSESHSKATDGQEKEHGQDKRTLTNQKGLGLKDILKSESEEPVAGPNLTCPGPEKQQVACNMKDCPGHGYWSQWADVGPCSATCGYGRKIRARVCSTAGGCQGKDREETSCNVKKCLSCGGLYSDPGEEVDHCYLLMTAHQYTWLDSDNWCRAQGGWLAEPRTAVEQRTLKKFLMKHGKGKDYWIGLSDRQTEGRFVWMKDGTKPVVTDWKSYGEPNGSGDCVCYWGLGWDDTKCDGKLHAICQKNKAIY